MREIKKILIANRGEIVKRIVQSAKEMGKKTVALCPQKGDEKNFPEVFFADEYYFLEEEGISGFLNQKKIIEIKIGKPLFFEKDSSPEEITKKVIEEIASLLGQKSPYKEKELCEK